MAAEHHCNKEKEIEAIHDFLKQLNWLTDEDMKNTMKEIVEEKRMMSLVANKWANGIKIFGIIVAIVGGIVTMILAVVRELRK